MIPIVTAVLASVAPKLAEHGLDLINEIFTGATKKGTEKVKELIKEKTGIELSDIADDNMEEADWERLKIFERENQAKLTYYMHIDDNDVQRGQTHQRDRDSARQMQQAALLSGDKIAQWFVYFYASAITLLTFAFIFYASFFHDFEANPGSERIIDTSIGFLLGIALSAIVQYFFGSSAGSRSKDHQITALSERK